MKVPSPSFCGSDFTQLTASEKDPAFIEALKRAKAAAQVEGDQHVLQALEDEIARLENAGVKVANEDGRKEPQGRVLLPTSSGLIGFDAEGSSTMLASSTAQSRERPVFARIDVVRFSPQQTTGVVTTGGVSLSPTQLQEVEASAVPAQNKDETGNTASAAQATASEADTVELSEEADTADSDEHCKEEKAENSDPASVQQYQAEDSAAGSALEEIASGQQKRSDKRTRDVFATSQVPAEGTGQPNPTSQVAGLSGQLDTQHHTQPLLKKRKST